MLEGFMEGQDVEGHLLGTRASSFKCQNVVLLCLGAVILFLSKVSWICFTFPGVQVSEGIFCPVFLFV